MTRNEAAAYLGARFGVYLTAVGRTATDTAGNLQAVLDDALRMLGLMVVPSTATGDEDWRVQLEYRLLLQVVRDLGTASDIGSQGDSISLNQQRKNAEKDLELARDAVLARFRTLGVIGSGGALGTLTLVSDVVAESLV